MSIEDNRRQMHPQNDEVQPAIEPTKISFTCVDVTEPRTIAEREYLGLAMSLTAEQYMSFLNTDPQIIAVNRSKYLIEVMEKLFGDKYVENHQARTKVALTPEGEVAGNMRFVVGNANIEYPLETMQLWKPMPLHEWPHRNNGLSDEQVGEFGRIAVAPNQRPHNTTAVIKSLFNEGFRDANARGIQQIYIVLPTAEERRLYTRIVDAGLQLEPIDGITLRDDLAEAKKVFDTFPGYWKLRQPKLFRLHVPPGKAA
jgi:hypothetical protein